MGPSISHFMPEIFKLWFAVLVDVRLSGTAPVLSTVESDPPKRV